MKHVIKGKECGEVTEWELFEDGTGDICLTANGLIVLWAVQGANKVCVQRLNFLRANLELEVIGANNGSS